MTEADGIVKVYISNIILDRLQNRTDYSKKNNMKARK